MIEQAPYTTLIRDAVLDERSFVRLTAKGPVRGQPSPWRRVIVRPVEIRGGRHLQFSYFDERQDTTKNYRGAEADARLDELLAIPFGAWNVETTGGSFQVQLTKKGKAIVHHSNASAAPRTPDLRHNTRKALPLPADQPDRFLQGLGIMNDEGRVNASMADKFAQINEFLKLLDHTGALETIERRPLMILDAGCGSSYLSFAVYHYLNAVREIPARLIGVDVNPKLIDKSNRLSAELGYDDMQFVTSPIVDFAPETPPDLLLALHACDTATDEALLQAIRHDVPLIMCAPCCHHHLHAQMEPVDPFRPIMQHGILRKRMGDVLTDALRAAILRIMGYRTDVVEFVSSEHTDRNLLIRAVRHGQRPERHLIEEYEALKRFWNVTPYLETLLRREHRWIDDAPDDQPSAASQQPPDS